MMLKTITAMTLSVVQKLMHPLFDCVNEFMLDV